MKKGVNMYTIPGSYTLDEAFGMIADAGFSGVELNMDGQAGARIDSSQEDIEQIKSLAGKYNLEIIGFTTGLLWQYQMTSNDEDTRQKGIASVKKLVDFAAFAGANSALVVPGCVTETTSYDDAYENALASMNELKHYAEEKKVYLCVENVWNKFLLSPLEMRKFIDKIDSEFVRAYFDVGNILLYGYPEHWIKILGSRIKKYHVKDFNTSIGNANGFANLLDGNVNWRAVMAAIKNTGYDGYITAEITTNPNKNFTPYLLKTTSDALDILFDM